MSSLPAMKQTTLMKFVDEVNIAVIAGKGGDGCLSFRREKFIPRGGPDGGDGGDGGSIYLQADVHHNTLAAFRYRREHHAQSGQPGMGRLRRGKSGQDLLLPVPVGTIVYDANTDECLGELLHDKARLCVAQGGYHGLGNARYKSSTNRAPRQTSEGAQGEQRQLRMELRLLADVGLLGLPNAGKSTLINAISNAKPKMAAYPFTTLYPSLGVVRMDALNSFVVADIPGLVKGASQGVGLGLHFLKHLRRCRLLLHIVDVCSDDGSDMVAAFKSLETELKQFSEELSQKECWLVLNKTDLANPTELDQQVREFKDATAWTGPVLQVSALHRQGTETLCWEIIKKLQQ